MFQYRAALTQMRKGDSDRSIARTRLMGRRKLAALRALATRQGWLEPAGALPEDAAIAAALGETRRPRSSISSVEPYRALVEGWVESGLSGVAIHATLVREYGYTGSYSSVYRMLARIERARPSQLPAASPMSFGLGEVAQPDFGARSLSSDTVNDS